MNDTRENPRWKPQIDDDAEVEEAEAEPTGEKGRNKQNKKEQKKKGKRHPSMHNRKLH